MLETGLLLAQLGGASPATVLDLATSAGELIDAPRTIAPGHRADLVVLGATDHERGLLDRALRRWVLARGRVVAELETRTELIAPGPG